MILISRINQCKANRPLLITVANLPCIYQSATITHATWMVTLSFPLSSRPKPEHLHVANTKSKYPSWNWMITTSNEAANTTSTLRLTFSTIWIDHISSKSSLANWRDCLFDLQLCLTWLLLSAFTGKPEKKSILFHAKPVVRVGRRAA